MADTTGPKTEFWCQECSRKYRDAASLQVTNRFLLLLKPLSSRRLSVPREVSIISRIISLINCQDHQRNKHGPKDVTCKLCQDKFRTRQQYKNHLRGTSHRSTAGNHCCVECGKPYKIWGFRRMHERDVHNILDVVFCKVSSLLLSQCTFHHADRYRNAQLASIAKKISRTIRRITVVAGNHTPTRREWTCSMSGKRQRSRARRQRIRATWVESSSRSNCTMVHGGSEY